MIIQYRHIATAAGILILLLWGGMFLSFLMDVHSEEDVVSVCTTISPTSAAPTSIPTFSPKPYGRSHASVPVYSSVGRSFSSAVVLPASSSATVHSYGGGYSSVGATYASHSASSTPLYAQAVVCPVGHLRTIASTVGNGMSSDATYASVIHRAGPGFTPGEDTRLDDCTHCIDDGTGVCSVCGERLDECECGGPGGYCRCPLDASTFTALPMLLMACVYILAKKSFFCAFCVRFVAGFKKKQYLCRQN